MSQERIPDSFAGDQERTLSTITPSSFFSTTAPIHSKSQERTSSNCCFSFFVINSLCLSPSDSTIPFIMPFTNTSFFIQSKE